MIRNIYNQSKQLKVKSNLYDNQNVLLEILFPGTSWKEIYERNKYNRVVNPVGMVIGSKIWINIMLRYWTKERGWLLVYTNPSPLCGPESRKHNDNTARVNLILLWPAFLAGDSLMLRK